MSPPMEHEKDENTSHCDGAKSGTSKGSFLERLPPELRIKIWSCATEPRVIRLDDLIQTPKAYPLPPVTQVNYEARKEIRPGYQHITSGSYVDLSRDILVCDCSMTFPYRDSNPFVEELSMKVEKFVYWDCFPDDGPATTPEGYAKWMSDVYRFETPGKLPFRRTLFPNVKELWIVKIGRIDPAWEVRYDLDACYEEKLQATARKFRYWVKDNVIEMADMAMDDPNLPLILRDGRCSQKECDIYNKGLHRIVSKVTFMEGNYREDADEEVWTPVTPLLKSGMGKSTANETEQQDNTPAMEGEVGGDNAASQDEGDEGGEGDEDAEIGSDENDGVEGDSDDEEKEKQRQEYVAALRWALVERNLTCSLMWEGSTVDRERTVGRTKTP